MSTAKVVYLSLDGSVFFLVVAMTVSHLDKDGTAEIIKSLAQETWNWGNDTDFSPLASEAKDDWLRRLRAWIPLDDAWLDLWCAIVKLDDLESVKVIIPHVYYVATSLLRDNKAIWENRTSIRQFLVLLFRPMCYELIRRSTMDLNCRPICCLLLWGMMDCPGLFTVNATDYYHGIVPMVSLILLIVVIVKGK
jgi:hypothetical protein